VVVELEEIAAEVKDNSAIMTLDTMRN